MVAEESWAYSVGSRSFHCGPHLESRGMIGSTDSSLFQNQLQESRNLIQPDSLYRENRDMAPTLDQCIIKGENFNQVECKFECSWEALYSHYKLYSAYNSPRGLDKMEILIQEVWARTWDAARWCCCYGWPMSLTLNGKGVQQHIEWHELGNHGHTWVPVPAPSLTTCVPLHKVLNLSGPPLLLTAFPQLQRKVMTLLRLFLYWLPAVLVQGQCSSSVVSFIIILLLHSGKTNVLDSRKALSIFCFVSFVCSLYPWFCTYS